MIGHVALAAQNHATKRMDCEPIWPGIVVWLAIFLAGYVLAGIL